MLKFKLTILKETFNALVTSALVNAVSVLILFEDLIY